MTLRAIRNLLGAEVLCDAALLDNEVNSAFAADLMSDVLAFVDERCLLLTGLVNQHVIITAEMVDVCGIVFVRGKKPGEEILQLAKERNIGILCTEKTLYESSGILYTHGLGSIKGR